MEERISQDLNLMSLQKCNNKKNTKNIKRREQAHYEALKNGSTVKY